MHCKLRWRVRSPRVSKGSVKRMVFHSDIENLVGVALPNGRASDTRAIAGLRRSSNLMRLHQVQV